MDQDVYERLESLRRRVSEALTGLYETAAHGGSVRPTDDEIVGFAEMRARQVQMLHRHHHADADTDGECPTCGMYARAAVPGPEGEAVERVRRVARTLALGATPDFTVASNGGSASFAADLNALLAIADRRS